MIIIIMTLCIHNEQMVITVTMVTGILTLGSATYIPMTNIPMMTIPMMVSMPSMIITMTEYMIIWIITLVCYEEPT